MKQFKTNKNMETTVRKRTKKMSRMEASIQKRIQEGKPLSAGAKYWLTMENIDDGSKMDMRAILR
ncbi:hypothetical protein AGMMS49982_07650 [Bacteroidia bacterium]|nr:hypothetical protein AGMMS49982_07650 [Bacteroidia bacterium]